MDMDKLLKKKSNKIDSPQKLARLIKDNTCVVIKISASWCGPCKNKEFLHNYHKLKDNFSSVDNVKFVELDIDDDAAILDDNEYYSIDVKSVPTFFISKNGNFTKKYEGATHLQSINKYLYDNTQTN